MSVINYKQLALSFLQAERPVKALQATVRATEADPDDAECFDLLGLLHRRAGKLTEAAGAYDRAVELGRGSASRHLRAVLRGEASTERPGPEEAWPAPFLRLDAPFTEDERASLWERAMTHEDAFSLAVSPRTKEVELSSRRTLVLKDVGELRELFHDRIHDLLPVACQHLQVPAFEVTRFELKMTVHLDGYYFKVHRDDLSRNGHDDRRISFLYYFHAHPKAFSGGDLLLYDTLAAEDSYLPQAFTRIEPVDGTLLLFPSGYYHQVTRVQLAENSFRNGRFAVGGHLGAEPNRDTDLGSA